MKTFYDTLEVSQKAGAEVLAASHKTLARRYHPDNKESGNPDKFRSVQQAFETLSVPARRAQYDKWLAGESEKEKQAKRQKREHAPAPGLPIDQILTAGVAAAASAACDQFGHIPGVREFVRGMQKPVEHTIREQLERVRRSA